MRTLWVATLALLVLAGGSWVVDARPGQGSSRAEVDQVVSPVAAPTRASRARCHGIDRRAVRGTEPTYTRKALARFRNHKRICRGVWLPKPRRHLVPQGLAVSGRTAWVSGYRHRKGFGKRPCQLVKVDLRTGKRLAYHRAIYGQVGKRPRTYCRHGGGIVKQGRWLWVVERSKLWLVDPAQGGKDLEARRAWRIEAPVRGSALVVTDRSIGLVPFEKDGAARLYWFSKKRLMRRGVVDLAVRSQGRKQLGAHSSLRVPRLVQGATRDSRGRIYFSRSNLACGELVTPQGRRVALVPGAEGLQLGPKGRRLWVVSESGSRPYIGLDKPFTPGVVGYEWPQLLRGRAAGCGFKRY